MADLARDEHWDAIVEPNTRFELVHGRRTPHVRSAMAREVRAGLSSVPRFISPRTPISYRPTPSDPDCSTRSASYPSTTSRGPERTSSNGTRTRSSAGSGARSLVEIGSGMARKTGLLARGGSLRAPPLPPIYVPLRHRARGDRGVGARSPRRLIRQLRVRQIVGDFVRDLCRVWRSTRPLIDGPRLLAFLGSTLGNLDKRAAPALSDPSRQIMNGVESLSPRRRSGEGSARFCTPRTNDAKGVTARVQQERPPRTRARTRRRRRRSVVR